ncbi:MAG: hypothetical protein EOO62_38295 [Hymenobacter sp.]|nr:MAG: hypothetical protein EOO62_38295 [Hymenobacter sp.]
MFKNQSALATFAGQLGFTLAAQSPKQLNLDAVAEWLTSDKKRPPLECLDAWNLFDDMSAGVGEPFAGNHKMPARDQVFDLLYVASGLWQQPAGAQWLAEDKALLHDILTQGFALWQKHACWQA